MESQKKFRNISYDLSQNYLINITEFESLEKTALISSVPHFMCDRYIRNYLQNYLPVINVSISEYYNRVETIAEEIFSRMKISFESRVINSKIMRFFIKSTVQFVVLQICDFIDQLKLPSPDLLLLFLSNLVMTNQGTVNTEKTIKKILSSDQLKPLFKFLLSAHFFLGPDIVNEYNYLTQIEKHHINNRLKEKLNVSLYYWMWKITGTRKRLRNNIIAFKYVDDEHFISVRSDDDDYFAIQEIFRKAMKYHFEIGVQYLWTNYISSMRERTLILMQLITVHTIESTHINTILYLIFQLNEHEINFTFHHLMPRILELIASNPRWVKNFFIVLNVLQPDFDDDNFLRVLRYITTLHFIKHPFSLKFDFLLRFFNEIPYSVKESMINESEESSIFYKELLLQTFQNGNIEVGKLFIEHCNHNNVFNFFISDPGIDLFFSAIKNMHFKFINEILNAIAKTVDEVSQIKIKIFESEDFFAVCSRFILDYNLEMADAFVKWFSGCVPRNEIFQFKHNLPYANKGDMIRSFLFPADTHSIHDPLEYTKEFLFWCMETEKNVELVRKNILIHVHDNEPYEDEFKIKCYEQVKHLFLHKKWIFLRRIIIWIKYSSAGKRALGRKLLNDKEVFKEMLKEEDVLKILRSCVDWYKETLGIDHGDGSIQELKVKVFNQNDLFLSLIRKGKFQDVQNIVEWCEPTEEKLKEFMNGTYLKLTEVSNSVNSGDLQVFLDWLKPSHPTVFKKWHIHEEKFKLYWFSLSAQTWGVKCQTF